MQRHFLSFPPPQRSRMMSKARRSHYIIEDDTVSQNMELHLEGPYVRA